MENENSHNKSRIFLGILGCLVIFSTVFTVPRNVFADQVNIGVDITQSPESAAAEQTHSTVTVDPSRVSGGSKGAILVELKGDGGSVLGIRMVTLRLFRGTTMIGTAQKVSNEQGLAFFTVASPVAQTVRVQVYDTSNTPTVKLIGEPVIMFDGGGSGPADIIVSSGVSSANPHWYQQIFTFLVGLFRFRF